MMHRLVATWVAVTVGAAVVIAGTIALWPASEEQVQIDALASTDLDAVRQAADRLGASGAGSPQAVDALRETRDRLVSLMIELGDRDLKQFGHLEFHQMVERISDRRQSSHAQHLWQALAAVTRALAALEPESAEALAPEREDWELSTQEEWDRRAKEWELRADEETGGAASTPLPFDEAREPGPAGELEGREGEAGGETRLEGDSEPGDEAPSDEPDGALREPVDLPVPDRRKADSAP